mmetsp:Transcript_5499/g.9303  ORF Transcript_5499/g.9303 Transcript_5499/m.9303 type:complete len:92 (-) Transcript_5499:2061-2336(-)
MAVSLSDEDDPEEDDDEELDDESVDDVESLPVEDDEVDEDDDALESSSLLDDEPLFKVDTARTEFEHTECAISDGTTLLDPALSLAEEDTT